MPGLWAAYASAVKLEPYSLVEPRRPLSPSLQAVLSPVEAERPPGSQ